MERKERENGRFNEVENEEGRKNNVVEVVEEENVEEKKVKHR